MPFCLPARIALPRLRTFCWFAHSTHGLTRLLPHLRRLLLRFCRNVRGERFYTDYTVRPAPRSVPRVCLLLDLRARSTRSIYRITVVAYAVTFRCPYRTPFCRARLLITLCPFDGYATALLMRIAAILVACLPFYVRTR